MKFTKIFLVIAASVGIMSCDLGMLDTESTYQVGSSNVWGKASLARLAVNGNDLISIGMKPGKEIGEMLNHLLDRVIRGKLENDRDVLLTYVKKKIQ